MSLLMKALEKAAKDRDDAREEELVVTGPSAAAAPPSAPKSELTLEPLKTESTPATEAPARPGGGTTRAAGRRAPREQAQAAILLEAGSGSQRPSTAGLLARPALLFGIAAALIAIGFGTYVYLQIFHPSIFFRAPAKPPPPPIASAPAAGAGSVPASAPSPAPPAATGPLASAPLLQQSAAEPVVIAPPPPAPPVVQAKPEPSAPPAAPAPAPAPRNTITVSRSSAVTPAVHPLLNEAYSALQSQQLVPARGAYDRMLRSDPRSTDALLGLAAIDMLEGKNDDAIRRYMKVLEVEPRNALAQSVLIGLLGRADPLSAETRLKQLIAREPSAFLYFTLGNLYADQFNWAAAQQSFFQAHHLEPTNPDYAYNLAVGLEHLSQSRLALGFYRRAVELAGSAARPNFNVALAQERISKLASQVE